MSDAPENRRGRLLVASPALDDPNFRRSVVLMLEHTDDGALGLVLNRPTELLAREALPSPLGDALAVDSAVCHGGPVQPEAVIVLADFVDATRAATLVLDSVGIVDPGGEMEGLADSVRAIRAFGGYAGWSGGQLEEELAQEAWIDAPALATDIFTDHHDGLWRTVLERKGGTWRLIARMPDDPNMN